MNRMIRSRLSCIAVLLLLPMVFVSCGMPCDECMEALESFCRLFYEVEADFSYFCMVMRPYICYPTGCEDYPAECAANWEQMQTIAIQFCEAHPQECQQAFYSWVASLEEAEE